MDTIERENIKFLAARAAIDQGMNEKRAYDLLEKDYEKAKRNNTAMEKFETKVIEKYFPLNG